MFYHHHLQHLNYFGDQSINWVGWFQFFAAVASVIVLAVTLEWLKKYTRATEQMLQNQTTPNVEVNMRYDSSSKKTYFWFQNPYSIPALVNFIVTTSDTRDEVVNQTLRIPPIHPSLSEFRRTAPNYDLKILNDKEVVLRVITRSAMKNGENGINEYTKSYRFNELESRWDETSWGYPDPAFPVAAENETRNPQRSERPPA